MSLEEPNGAAYTLTPAQNNVVQSVAAARESICIIHGKAGTGKSVVRNRLQKTLPGAKILGPTGISIKGAGMTVAKFLKQRHKDAKTLIVDEMSMLSAKDFSKLLCCLRGRRLILIGDLYQLKPVEGQYFFTSTAWKSLNKERKVRWFELTDVLRTDRSDPEEAEELERFLDSLRSGSLSIDSYARDILDYVFSRRSPEDDTLVLCATRDTAEEINTRRLENLDGDIVGNFKTGARVQLIENIYNGNVLVAANGEIGTLMLEGASPVLCIGDVTVNTENLLEKIRPGYAITVHSAQGLSLDAVHIIGPNMFEGRQHLYTAFSRARRFSGISVQNLSSYDTDNLKSEIPPDVFRFLNDNTSLKQDFT